MLYGDLQAIHTLKKNQCHMHVIRQMYKGNTKIRNDSHIKSKRIPYICDLDNCTQMNIEIRTQDRS